MYRARLLRTAILLALGSAPALPGAAWAALAAGNPFAAPSTLPFGAARFDAIRDSDYQPAFEAGIAEQAADYDRIAADPAAPSFDNTIAALETSGRLLDRVSLTFSAVNGANTDDALDAVQAAMAPKLTGLRDAMLLNPRLFARVRSLHDQAASLSLTPEQRQVLGLYYQQFVHGGAQLKPDQQQKLRTLNTRISVLETGFQQKLLAAAKAGALVVTDKGKLAGLDDAALAAALRTGADRKLAAGSYVLPLQNTTQQPALASLSDRQTRAALFDAAWTRTERGDGNDTRATISELAQLRAQKAALFGYPNFAAYTLYDQMANTPRKVADFLARLVPATAAEQKREAADLQALIRKDGQDFTLRPWDWTRYADQLRRDRFKLDEAEVKPYLNIDRVLREGVFYAANQLYGLTFTERHDIPVWNPDVRTFTVHDSDGSELGLMYFDYWKRDNKNGGAWMSNLVNQSTLLGTKPVIYNVANFTKPAPGQPPLISMDDVTTMFHEFGHALHGLFAHQVYPMDSGTNVARDYVEFPSQFNEHWALYPQVLAHYARDERTGAPMPQALIDRIKNAAQFGQGYSLGEVIAASMLDIDWHELPASAPRQDVDRFEADALGRTGLDIADVPTRYRSSYFLHIWANGYAAGYYAYLWTEMLDDDAFDWFVRHGGLNRANGDRFRDLILSRGHTEDYEPMFSRFYGQAPDITPMLRHRGLAPDPL